MMRITLLPDVSLCIAQRRITETSEKLAKSLPGPLVKLSNKFPGDDKRSN